MRKFKLLFASLAFVVGGMNSLWAGTKTVYFAPTTGDNGWTKDGARFALFMNNNSDTEGAWADFTLAPGETVIYQATFTDTYTNMRICRMNGKTTENSVSNKWNWTSNISAPTVNDLLYVITGWNEDNFYSIPYELRNGGTFYLYNVGAGKFLRSGNWWGSQASLIDEGGIPITIERSDATFRLSTNSIYSGKYVHKSDSNGDVFLDSGDITYWTFEKVTDDIYKIHAGDKYFYWNNETAALNGTDPGTNASQWKLFTESERVADLAEATNNSSKDATFLIKNYYFAYGEGMIVAKNADLSSSPSWKGTSMTDVGGCHTWESTASYAAEQFEKTFDNYQELSLPNGRYHMTAKVLYRTKTNYTAIPYIYATTNGVTVKCDAKEKGNEVTDLSTAAQALMGDTYLLDGVDVIVTNRSLRVGVKSDANVDWCAFDDFSLLYYGNAVEAYSLEAYTNNAVASAEKWYYVTIPATGTYQITHGGNSDNTIYYTQDANDDADNDVTSLVVSTSGACVNLSAGTFYFKSAVTNSFAIAPCTVSDGTYYLYDATNKMFLSRGADWGTRATADIYGVPVIWNNSAMGITFIDQPNTFLFFDGEIASAWLYTDGGSDKTNRYFVFTDAGDGKYYLQDNGKTVYIKHANGVIEQTADASLATKWTLQSIAEHDAIVNTYPTDNINNVIDASGLSNSTTTANFETYLSENYYADDSKTTLINTPSTENGWTWAGYRGNPTYAESWAQIHRISGKYTFTIPASNLPAGIYKVEMSGFDRRTSVDGEASLYNTYPHLSASYLKVNNEQVRIISSWDMFANGGSEYEGSGKHSWYYQTKALNDGHAREAVYVYLDGNTDLDITIEKPDYNGGDSQNGSVLVFGDYKLTYYQEKVTISETATYEPVAKPSAYVTLNRSFVNDSKWNTFVVPFAISNDELKTAFGNDVEVAVYSSEANSGNSALTDISFNKMQTPAVSANTPVLLKTNSTGSSFVFANRTISTEMPQVVGGHGYDFVGSYTYPTEVATGDYILSNNQLLKSIGSSKIKGTRAYVKAKAQGARMGKLFIDGEETTGIDGMELNPAEAGKIYNLQGQRVENAKKGLYIQNGKKVVIK